jgi:hypothetical protein
VVGLSLSIEMHPSSELRRVRVEREKGEEVGGGCTLIAGKCARYITINYIIVAATEASTTKLLNLHHK